MYIPGHYVESDKAIAAQLIADNAFGLLITNGTDAAAPFATPMPFIYRKDEGEFGTLYGHVARANPQWRGYDGKVQALAAFMGPHGYVSPTWYAAKQAVPTWNYAAVHATGAPRLIPDPEARAMLDEMVAFFEDPKNPWSTATQSSDFIQTMIRGIAAFAMPVATLQIKLKLSQNRQAADRIGVAAGLRSAGNPVLADMVEKLLPPVSA